MGKIERNKLKKKNALLNSAYELFTSHGFSKTSVLNITLKAGVAKGTFYLYFNDKDDIKKELTIIKSHRLLVNATNSLNENEEKLSFPDKMIYIINYIIDQLKEDLPQLKFITKNLSWGILTESIEYSNTGEAISFHDYIDKMLEEDNIRLKDSDLMIYTIMELVSSTIYNIILNGQPTTIDEYKPYLYKHILNIIDDSII